MAQIKIFGIKEQLQPLREKLSGLIHACVMEALGMPADKKAHRFFYLEKEDFVYPSGRTDQYTILEISLITGRTIETKKKLIRLLYDRFQQDAGIGSNDLEICIYESPACNWGFRGLHGDEAKLNYAITV